MGWFVWFPLVWLVSLLVWFQLAVILGGGFLTEWSVMFLSRWLPLALSRWYVLQFDRPLTCQHVCLHVCHVSLCLFTIWPVGLHVWMSVLYVLTVSLSVCSDCQPVSVLTYSLLDCLPVLSALSAMPVSALSVLYIIHMASWRKKGYASFKITNLKSILNVRWEIFCGHDAHYRKKDVRAAVP